MTLRLLPPPEVSPFDFDSDIRDGIRPPFYQEVSEDNVIIILTSYASYKCSYWVCFVI